MRRETCGRKNARGADTGASRAMPSCHGKVTTPPGQQKAASYKWETPFTKPLEKKSAPIMPSAILLLLQSKAAALTYIQKPLLICFGITYICPFTAFYIPQDSFILASLGQA